MSPRSSPLFYIDFCLAKNKLGKQNVGKIFLANFIFLKGPIVALLKLPL